MRDNYKLSVVFCAVNETFSLMETFSVISKFELVDEYLFVLSKNASAECVETVTGICQSNKLCRYFFQSGTGLGNAIRDAIDSVSGTHMIVWPSDNGMDTSVFPQMVEMSEMQYDKIISVSRWKAEDGFRGYGKVRKIINFLSQKMFAFLFHSELTDFTNPTQIAPVSIYRQINWEQNGFAFVPELTFKPLKCGVEFIEIPCKSLVREEGYSNSKLIDLIKYYFVIMKIFFSGTQKIGKGISK